MVNKTKIKYMLYLMADYLKIQGRAHNTISFGSNAKFRNVSIKFQGKNNKLIIGEGCNLSRASLLFVGDNNEIVFGDRVVINASKFQPTVINSIDGSKIQIGKDSLLSNNIEIHTSDYHGMYNNSDGWRINKEKDIIIGDRVWIGLRAILLKGTIIPEGCVVGAGSITSGRFNEKNSVLVGSPAKIIKRNIIWDVHRKDKYSNVIDSIIH